jgi:F0F1-type ATP synthase delta subunit
MAAPSIVRELVDRFPARGSSSFLALKETPVRREFIDPFFTALGWDVANIAGQPFDYKEVIHEDQIRVGNGRLSAPDYAFRVQGKRKFFVEAKKPSVNLKDDPHPARQLRRYAWSANLPLSIVSDFQEFGVYDCRVEPGPDDRADEACELFLDYEEYEQQWDRIYSLFSKEAVLDGSLERFAQQPTRNRGTKSVDAAFLKDMEMFRLLLAGNIAQQNPDLSGEQLNYAVQITLNRILFLRISEDRGVEPLDQLKLHVHQERAYSRLCKLFLEADERYNSGLFHFRIEQGRSTPTDDLSLRLSIDDEPLRHIVDRLYYPCPYKFEMIPIEIMGQVYEQFMGRVIELNDSRNVSIVEKPEVKKAGGIYYTPTYIVNYIVQTTLSKVLDDKSIKDASSIRVLDPACGSGSFLVGAYRYLLEWHRTKYLEDTQKNKRVLYKDIYGDWQLTTSERKRILINSIYGVDIDPQAVENTKLALLLVVLEGATSESLGFQMRFARERALPDLDTNIKCGNSLIDFSYRQLDTVTEDELRHINPFDWHTAFPEIMKSGGFHAVIGNPPYIRSQALGKHQRDYYARTYSTATATYDIYVLFVEQTIRLLNEVSRAGFILPNKFFTTDYGVGLRKILAQYQLCERLVDFEDAQVFAGTGTYTTLLFLSTIPTEHPEYVGLGAVYRKEGKQGLARVLVTNSPGFSPLTLPPDGSRWTLATGDAGRVILRLQKTLPPLSTFAPHIFQGLKTSADKTYIINVRRREGSLCIGTNGFGEEVTLEAGILKQMVKGEHIRQYSVDLSAELFILYPYAVDHNGRASLLTEAVLSTQFPRAWEYLNKHRALLGARDGGKWATRPDWYAYARSQNIGAFAEPKFLVPYMTMRLRAAYDEEELFLVNITTGGYGLRVHLEQHHHYYMLALLNSKLLNHCVGQSTNRFRGGYLAVNKQALERLPIRTINFSDATDRGLHDRLVRNVTSMLGLHKQLAEALTPNDKSRFERRIQEAERQIDILVYELYKLTDEEIRVIEGEREPLHRGQVQQSADIWQPLSVVKSIAG